MAISILAPARGATNVLPKVRNTGNYFNSRPCERGDVRQLKLQQNLLLFQFSPLREGRQIRRHSAELYSAFQFSPLREGRPWCRWHYNRRQLFQFSPLREGRQQKFPVTTYRSLFQFSPLREGRHLDKVLGGFFMDFNSRPCERGDLI